jgi:hypothetical protein
MHVLCKRVYVESGQTYTQINMSPHTQTNTNEKRPNGQNPNSI